MPKDLKISIVLFAIASTLSCSNDNDDCKCTGRYELPSGEILTAENVNCNTGLYDESDDQYVVTGQPIGSVLGRYIGCE